MAQDNSWMPEWTGQVDEAEDFVQDPQQHQPNTYIDDGIDNDENNAGSSLPSIIEHSEQPSSVEQGHSEQRSQTGTPALPPPVKIEPPKQPEVVDESQEPKSESKALSEHLKKYPYDDEGWRLYISVAEQSGDLDILGKAYESLLEAYPNTPSAQIAYLTNYLTPTLFPTAEALFSRFLRPSPFVDVWKFYLTYVRRVNPNVTDPTARNIIKKSYEFALTHVGHDKDSGDIWRDYIDFLKDGEARTTWDGQQKMDALRSAYQRAVVVPLENVESLWRELDAFESGLNKITAKKFMADLSPSYMTARTALRDLRRLAEPLSASSTKPSATSTSTSPPPLTLATRPTWVGDSDRALSHAWKAYLKWEEGNPLDIDDNAMLQARISAAYRKAVVAMRFFPEIWYMAYHWNLGIGKVDEAAATLKQGMDANKSSFLLHFAYAELQESQNKNSEVHTAFDSLIATLHDQLESLDISIKEEVEAARASVPSTGVVNGELNMERDERGKQVLDKRSKELEIMRGELGIVWIMLMRFARRAEGLKPARSVFTKARKDKWASWGVYEAAALMEYHCTKAADVATKIFEIGLKLFKTNADFVVRYLGFLISINDENNARALFERVIGEFTAETARPLWERWARYEYHFGDLAAAQKLEKRITEVYPNDPPIKRFAQRYTYLGIDAIADRDLGFAYRRPGQKPAVQPPPPPPIPQPITQFTQSTKRAASPEPARRRRDPSPPPAKRFKASTPPPRERDSRWSDIATRKPQSPRPVREKEDDKAVGAVPNPVMWFLGTLPAAAAFDGPVFRTDDLLELFRHGNIPQPGSAPPPPRPRSPPGRGGRPPPDYSPYQGPGSANRGRRY